MKSVSEDDLPTPSKNHPQLDEDAGRRHPHLRDQKVSVRAKRRRRRLLQIAVVLAVVSLLWEYRLVPLRAIAYNLVRDDQPLPADDGTSDIFLLMGDQTPGRADAALAALQRGLGHRIILAEAEPSGFQNIGVAPGFARVHADYYARRGLADEALVVIPGCSNGSTLAEARCFLEFLQQSADQLPKRIVVVTSWYHSSRAGWLFEHVMKPAGIRVDVVAASTPESNPQFWWRSEASFLAVFSEYLKWTYWLITQPLTNP